MQLFFIVYIIGKRVGSSASKHERPRVCQEESNHSLCACFVMPPPGLLQQLGSVKSFTGQGMDINITFSQLTFTPRI